MIAMARLFISIAVTVYSKSPNPSRKDHFFGHPVLKIYLQYSIVCNNVCFTLFSDLKMQLYENLVSLIMKYEPWYQ